MKHQIIISSYAKDFPFLGPCLRSLKKFATEFLPTVVSVAPHDWEGAQKVIDRNDPTARLVIHCDERGIARGNLRAQISMMSADKFTPDADYFWFVGSDCLLFDHLVPGTFFCEGRPVMLVNTYEHLFKFVPRACLTPWQDGVEAALGIRPDFEFMRRLPLMYPRELLKMTREAIAERHGCTFEDYVYERTFRTNRGERSDASNFSESNVLGAYAYHYQHDMFTWVNIDDQIDPTREANKLIQFWSHGGLDHPCDCRTDYVGTNTFGKTPRKIITEVLGPDALA